MITIQGKGVSTGVAVGPLYFYKRTDQTIRRYETEDQEAEWNRFKEAQQAAIDQLENLKGLEVHSSVILSQIDSGVFKKLGVNLTCEPQYESNKLYHK